jgi:hypothetical protein
MIVIKTAEDKNSGHFYNLVELYCDQDVSGAQYVLSLSSRANDSTQDRPHYEPVPVDTSETKEKYDAEYQQDPAPTVVDDGDTIPRGTDVSEELGELRGNTNELDVQQEVSSDGISIPLIAVVYT